MSHSEAKAERKAGTVLPSLLSRPHIASGCVANLKTAPQPEAPGQVNRPLSQKDWVYVSVGSMCSAESYLCNCYSPVGPRNGSLSSHQSQAIKEGPLGGLGVPATSTGLWESTWLRNGLWCH